MHTVHQNQFTAFTVDMEFPCSLRDEKNKRFAGFDHETIPFPVPNLGFESRFIQNSQNQSFQVE